MMPKTSISSIPIPDYGVQQSMSATSELITGLIISQIALVRVLERECGLRKQDYIDELQRWIDEQPSEQQSADRYLPLRMLIEKLSATRRLRQ
jgi:hypothetical protein